LTDRLERAFLQHPWRIVIVGGIACGGLVGGVGILVAAAVLS
jgi:hypothetical protein